MITREIQKGELFADRYRVLRRLGAGGMATVWLAEDERLGREVAIKRLNTDAPEESLTRFRREARIGATLNHPNFVSVFDTIATDEGALIVMEYVPGPSVEELAKDGPMDPEQVVSILRGAAAALDHAHGEGVVHRDIKPANILVREDGTVKLADLGIARAVDATQITAEGNVIGTAPYMAPERFEAAGAGGPASDVYALAAVAYELLSGLPVDEAAPRGEHPPDRWALSARWRDASAQVFAVVMRGLSRDPARRQSSAGQLVAELDEALARGDGDTQPFTPPPTGSRARPLRPWTPTGPPLRRSRLGGMLALTLAALAVLAVAGIALIDGGSDGGKAPKTKQVGARENSGGGGGGASQAAPTGAVSAPVEEDQASASPSSADGASLNEEGFWLIQQGRAAEAVRSFGGRLSPSRTAPPT